MDITKFKPIPDFENYLISEKGEIYSKKSRKLMKQNVERFEKVHQYITVWLKKNADIGKSLKVHRLVALTYIPNPGNKKTVNHKDGNIYNNNVTNLEWASHQEQIDHCMINKLRKKKPCRTQVVKLDEKGLVSFYDSVTEAAQGEKTSTSNISRWINGRTPKDGSKWFYKDDYEMGEKLLEKEIWKKVIIEGEETQYFISNMGRLRFGKLLRKGHIQYGYRKYGLMINGKKIDRHAHILVANAFLDPPSSPKMSVDHKDRDPLNNRVENLRWATPSEQIKNTDKSNSGKSAKGVIMSNKIGEELRRFQHVAEAYEFVTGKKGTGKVIASACRKEREFAHGHRWSYIEDYYEAKPKGKLNFNQPIIKVTKAGEIIKYENLKDACKKEEREEGRVRLWIRKERSKPPDGSEWFLEIEYNKLSRGNGKSHEKGKHADPL